MGTLVSVLDPFISVGAFPALAYVAGACLGGAALGASCLAGAASFLGSSFLACYYSGAFSSYYNIINIFEFLPSWEQMFLAWQVLLRPWRLYRFRRNQHQPQQCLPR